MRLISILILTSLAIGLTAHGDGILSIFVQPGSVVDEAFQAEALPQIRQLAADADTEVRVLDARKGVPEQVTQTPLLVYHNHRGRTIYHGRTNTPSRLESFIWSASYVAQQERPFARTNVLAWNTERATVVAPLKITKIQGTPPANYNHQAFVAESVKSIGRGLEKFSFQDRIDVNRPDRTFYMDIHPWRGEDDMLYLDLFLFSEFHCDIPLFTTPDDEPLTGSWKDRDNLFEEAAGILENEVMKTIESPLAGDGFDIIEATVPIVTWEHLGLALPPAPAAVPAPAGNVDDVRKWTIANKSKGPPMLRFTFPSPIDHYTGVAKHLTGALNLPDTGLDGSTGFFEVPISALTMGDPELDSTIRSSVFLHASKYPTSRFTFTLNTAFERLEYGRLAQVTLDGAFRMKAKTIPLAVVAEAEPIIGRYGKALLVIRGVFEIDLRPFKVEQADGPESARYTVLYSFDFRLTPE